MKIKTSIEYNHKISKIKLKYFERSFSLIDTIFETIKYRILFYIFFILIFNHIQCLRTMFL